MQYCKVVLIKCIPDNNYCDNDNDDDGGGGDRDDDGVKLPLLLHLLLIRTVVDYRNKVCFVSNVVYGKKAVTPQLIMTFHVIHSVLD